MHSKMLIDNSEISLIIYVSFRTAQTTIYFSSKHCMYLYEYPIALDISEKQLNVSKMFYALKYTS